jgi:CRP-like cAMP-binding protein
MKSSNTQKELILKIVCTGEMFGEEGPTGNQIYSYYAEALETTHSSFLGREALGRMIERFPVLKVNFTIKLALEVKALQKSCLN